MFYHIIGFIPSKVARIITLLSMIRFWAAAGPLIGPRSTVTDWEEQVKTAERVSWSRSTVHSNTGSDQTKRHSDHVSYRTACKLPISYCDCPPSSNSIIDTSITSFCK